MAPPLALVGPTGTGKTAISLRLAETLGAEIVCADSRQLYRGLDVATGKPTKEERARVPHHLYDWLPPTQPASAGRYARAAHECVRAIEGRGRCALLVGGTGLYVRALRRGLAALPPIDPVVRADVRVALAVRGPAALHEELAQLDPRTAARLGPRDAPRIGRALEVVRGTGRTLSEWQEAPRAPAPIPDLRLVCLTRDRASLYAALDARTRAFFENGVIEEVQALLAAGVPRQAPAFTGIGYAEAAALHEGLLSREEALAAAQQATRRYAKRQWTWWRGEARHAPVTWIDVEGRDAEEIAREIVTVAT